ncbi:inversin [Megalops cyprinoides]|uniref:inversin n=1 Tax=Megalops cyprinoides TaxID=118141 RepID=UPI0018645106|nr:inversin [Megalops cyprinoides]
MATLLPPCPSDPASPGSTPLGSQVHAAAVNGDRSALHRLITADPSLRDREDQFGRTPLMYCVLADRLDCAETLLKAGASVNKADRSQRTALHLAAQKGNVRFMKLLLARRADWLQKDLEEMTPLHLATRHRSPKCLSLLLKHMAPGEVDTQDKNKQTALHWSAFYNHPEHVKLLIKHDSNIGIPDSEGKIPLHWAAHNKDPSAIHTVRCILDAAPTESLLNWQDYEGRTPLHFAVADGNEAVVEVLTSYEGCSVTAYDNLFRTPLHWAALLGHARIVHLLLERNTSGTIPSDSQGATPLHYGAQSNFADTVAVFLKHPSVKDDPDLEGRTAFMWAAGKGSDDVIRTMLDLKPDIDINMADKYGGTALHAAALSGHVGTVRLLLERGAMVDSLDVMKHTPLFRACEMGHRDVILTLIKGEARVDLVDLDGHTALHWAALGGNAEVCQILMENGITPNVQDLAGRTPLQCAAYGGYINCMAVLMENRADPNIQDKEGRTALHWSCNNGYLDAVKLLLGYNAFPNHMEHNEERYTPLDYALLGEHQEVTQFMLEHGALSIAAIQDIAASSIQAVYKGYKVRKAFRERKNLLMRHEQLRKDAAKKREEEHRRREAEQQVSLAEAERGLQALSVTDTQGGGDTTGPRGHSSRRPSKAERGHAHSSKSRTEDQRRHREHRNRSTGKGERRVKEAEVAPCPGQGGASGNAEKKCVAPPEKAPSGLEETSGPSGSNPGKSPEASTKVGVKGSKGGRHSPAGSSRPGSAKPGTAPAQTAPRPARAPTPTQGSQLPPRSPRARAGLQPRPAPAPSPSSPARVVVGPAPAPSSLARVGVAPAPSSLARVGGAPAPSSLTRVGGAPAPALLGPWKDGSVELVPLELRLKVVERERSCKELIHRKHQAASTIQRAWRRFHVRGRLKEALGGSEEGAESAEATSLLIQLLWDRRSAPGPAPTKTTPEHRAPPTSRAVGKKSTVLQSIYGGSQARRGRPTRSATLNSRSHSQILLDLSLSTNTQLSSIQCVHLLESVGQARQFSYHMRPHSATQGPRGRGKH